jgi:hypothetical protein
VSRLNLCARGDSGLPAHSLFKTVRNRVVVEWETINVRAFVIVDSRRHTDKQRLCVADVMVSVKNISWNDHQCAVVLRAINFVNHLISWRFRAVVIQHNLDRALADENPVVVEMMEVPAFYFARPNRELINIDNWSGMRFKSEA